jgi:chromosome segregation ATPase
MGRKPGQRAETEKRLWELFERIKAEGRPTGPTAFAHEAGIDRTYFYSFRELAAAVSAYGRTTQPHISRRGAGIKAAEAKRRQVEDQVRREHTRWAEELPKLRRQLEEAEMAVRQRDERIEELLEKIQLLRRAYEYLLMLASEAGASPSELEAIRQKVA